MKIEYNGVSIENQVQVIEAKYTDCSGGKFDSLHMTFGQGAAWNQWKPEKNDEIRVKENDIDTGKMYVTAVVPMGREYKIIATAARSGAGQKKTKSYEGFTIGQIIRLCAKEDGMDAGVYGIDENTVIAYIEQNCEANPAFLERLAKLNGAVLKTYNGKYVMIGIEEAQEEEPIETMRLDQGSEYTHRIKQEKAKMLRVVTPYAEVQAEDESADDGEVITVSDIPAKDAGSAARMARGLLLGINRGKEELEIMTLLHPQWTAMMRVDIAGMPTESGEWIVDEVVHDLKGKTSRGKFLRVIRTVR